MAISNTSILIKRSTGTAVPTSLKAGELGYSYVSNTIFIGTSDGTGAIALAGNATFATVNSATAANTASTLVKRDTVGGFAGQLYGNANTASALYAPQNFSISGGDITASAQSFQGNNSVTLSASLNSITGLTAGTYGGATAVPVVQVAANGRIMSISNTTISTSFTVAGNTGSGTQNGGGTLTFQGGGTGITTTVTGTGNETVTFNTDNTVVRSNTATVGPQTIGTDLYVSGNLVVSGTRTFVNTSIVQTTDSMIVLASNNTSDVIDIGFVGKYGAGSSLATGLVRDAGNKAYYLFAGVDAGSISNANTIANNLFTAANTATLYSNLNSVTANITNLGVTTFNVTNSGVVNSNVTNAGIVTANIGAATIGNLYLTSALPIASGGTNNTTYTAGQRIIYTGTQLASQANTGTAGTYGNSAYIPVITTNAYGEVSSVTNTAIAIDTSQITSGTLGFARGGTGSTSYTTGALLVAGATGLQSIANTTYTLTGGFSAANTLTALTVDAYGRVTAATGAAISGLTVPQGGTGQSTFTAGQIVVGNGTGALSQIANSSLTVTGGLAAGNTITSITVDAYGRLTAYTGSLISGLTVPQGGTGLATATTNGITYGNGTAALGVTAAAGTSDQTWSNQILTVTNAGVPVWSSAMDGGTF